MAINYTALADEINGDPKTYGYAPYVAAGDDLGVANLLNKVRDGTDGETAITVRRTDISPADVLEVIDVRDFDDAAPGLPFSTSWFESATQLRSMQLIDEAGQDTRILGNLRRVLRNPSPQGSRDRLNALTTRYGSRAEQLFGSGTVITPEDVALALRPPPPQALRV